MFDFVGIVALICVCIWAAVSLIKHFMPDYYSRESSMFDGFMHKKVKAIEDHLGISFEEKIVAKPKDEAKG